MGHWSQKEAKADKSFIGGVLVVVVFGVVIFLILGGLPAVHLEQQVW